MQRRSLSPLLQAHYGIGYQHMAGGGAGHTRAVPVERSPDVIEGVRRRVFFYDYDVVHPSKQLAYFIMRHLRRLPEEWQLYYHHLYRSEFRATENVNKNWDQFCYVLEGYRKAKWVLKKYGLEPAPGSVPEPYHSQWANATQEERAWAYRRSFQLKELQALQRETCDAFGSVSRDRSSTSNSHMMSTSVDPMRTQTGTNVHSDDMAAPREGDIRDDGEMSEVFMMSIQDDKRWNPLMKKDQAASAEFWQFEDEDDDDDDKPDSSADDDDSAASGTLSKRKILASSMKKRSGNSAAADAGFSASALRGAGDDLDVGGGGGGAGGEDDEAIDEADFARHMAAKGADSVGAGVGARNAEAFARAPAPQTDVIRPSSRIPSRDQALRREI